MVGFESAGFARRQRESLLGDLSVFELPTDRPRLPIDTFPGAADRFEIPPQLASAFKSLSTRENAALVSI